MLAAYATGVLTPNPDVLCNQHIKGHSLPEFAAAKFGTSIVATGHYARKEKVVDEITGHERWRLLQAADKMKDQTYFLCKLTQKQLASLEFPLGDFESKDLVKEVALRQKSCPMIANIAATKKESVGVCFIGKRHNFKEFLKQYLPPPEEGPMVLLESREERELRAKAEMEEELERTQRVREKGKRERGRYPSGAESGECLDGQKGQGKSLHRGNTATEQRQTAEYVRTRAAQSEGERTEIKEKRNILERQHRVKGKKGNSVFMSEKVLGRHEGLCFYTIGQRVKLSGGASKYYVAKKDTAKNALYLVTSNTHSALSSTVIHAAQFSWISGEPPAALFVPEGLHLTARVRHRGDLLDCVARIVPTNTLGAEVEPLFKALGMATWKKASPKLKLKDWSTVVEVRLNEPVVAAAPGQYVVLYKGEECLGGGHIASVRA